MQETFTGNVMPAGWVQDSSGYTPVLPVWKFNGVTNGVIGIGFDTNYIRAYGGGVNNSLTTNSINVTNLNTVYLSYSEYASGPSGNGYMITEVSNNGGASWQEFFSVLHGNLAGPLNGWRKVIDLSSYAANQANVKIRFRYGPNYNDWALDSIVVSDVADCSSPADPKGITANDKPFLCTGSTTNLELLNLSRGIGQTYQWQVQNPANGNVFTNIPGAIYDTLHYVQNGSSYYRCVLTCNGSTATTSPLKLYDYPPDPTEVVSPNDRGICNLLDDTLYLQTTNHHLGVGFQWMDDDSAYGVYNPIAGATDSFYVVKGSNYSADTYFKCKEVCLQSGLFKLSDFWLEYVNVNTYCYCEPNSYSDCDGSSLYTGGMVNVAIQNTTLSNASVTCFNQMGNTNNYSFYAPTISNCTAVLSKGVSYNLSVTIDTIAPFMIGMWIDYDRNNFFDSSEYTLIAPFSVPAGSTTVTSFTVPVTATAGLTGMRVRCTGNFPGLLPDRACAGVFGGETEDYMITIDTATGVTDLTAQQGLQLQVYPNPISGRQQLTVAVGSGSRQANGVEIATMQGSVVLKESFTGSTFTTLADFAPGVYAVRVITPGGTKEKKLVVTR